ncbi:MAG: hypothetical protein QG662_1060 [Pseudomonadota bacterium]|nr:hypothetical protein [Pseudomonadota bacterium]
MAWLISGLALAGPRAALAALPPAEAAAASANVEARSEPVAESGDEGWMQLPPVSWSGSLTYDLAYLTADESEDSLRQGLTARINGRTFIWQPWFAHLSGTVGLTAATGDGSGNSEALTGELQLDILPQSRFPFMAAYSRSNSQFSSDAVAVTNDYTSQRFTLSQHYRPLESDTQYSASFIHNSQDGESFGETAQDTLQLDLSTRLGDYQSLQLSANGSRNTHERTDQTATQYNLLANHRYTPDPTLSVESQASMNQYDYRLAQGSYESRYTQLHSYAFWRPEDMPMTATGSVRLSNIASGGGSGTNSMNVSAGANYELTRQTRLFANASVNLSDSGSDQDVSTSQTLGASYNPDPLMLGGFHYNWFASGSVSNTTGGEESGGQQASLQLGHNLDRSMSFLGGSLGFSLNQNLSAIEGNNTDQTLQLMQGGSLAWNVSRGSSMAYFRLNATDSRSLGGDEERAFQLVNFQASMNQITGRYSTWNGNLTVQATRQNVAGVAGTQDTEMGDFEISTSASLSYQNQRAFGVSRLRFGSDLRINNNQYKTVLGGPEDSVDKSWRNQFEYAVGRTRFKLTETWSEMDGRSSVLVMFTLERYFWN